MARLELTQLPAEVVAFVEDLLGGALVEFENQAGGFSQGTAARVRTANGARGFLKAVHREGFEGTYRLYEREVEILSLLPRMARVPQLLGSYAQSGWLALLIEDVEGRYPDTRADMHAVLDSLLTLPSADAVPGLPDVADDLAPALTQWDRIDAGYSAMDDWAVSHVPLLRAASERAVEAASGNDLVHNDLRPDNILIDAQGAAWIVDWPWAARGALWYDALLFVLDCSLIDPTIDVEHEIASHSVFRGVTDQQIDAVLAGFASYYVYQADQPAIEVPQSLREHQYQHARVILEWLERRWSRR
jgi:aminoglycoside phosphotransferase (APT) family kinase protein